MCWTGRSTTDHCFDSKVTSMVKIWRMEIVNKRMIHYTLYYHQQLFVTIPRTWTFVPDRCPTFRKCLHILVIVSKDCSYSCEKRTQASTKLLLFNKTLKNCWIFKATMTWWLRTTSILEGIWTYSQQWSIIDYARSKRFPRSSSVLYRVSWRNWRRNSEPEATLCNRLECSESWFEDFSSEKSCSKVD